MDADKNKNLKAGSRVLRNSQFCKYLQSLSQGYRNNNGAKVARLRRQTIQVCMPGVSISVTWTPFPFSHSRNLRFPVMSLSSVPHAIHNSLSWLFAFSSSFG